MCLTVVLLLSFYFFFIPAYSVFSLKGFFSLRFFPTSIWSWYRSSDVSCVICPSVINFLVLNVRLPDWRWYFPKNICISYSVFSRTQSIDVETRRKFGRLRQNSLRANPSCHKTITLEPKTPRATWPVSARRASTTLSVSCCIRLDTGTQETESAVFPNTLIQRERSYRKHIRPSRSLWRGKNSCSVLYYSYDYASVVYTIIHALKHTEIIHAGHFEAYLFRTYDTSAAL